MLRAPAFAAVAIDVESIDDHGLREHVNVLREVAATGK